MAPFIEAEHEPGPACASDEDLIDYVRRRGSTVYHPTSTCRMGEDATAVVDARLRVRGIERLRIVDASIMPALVSGNTNAADDHDRRKGRRHDLGRREGRALVVLRQVVAGCHICSLPARRGSGKWLSDESIPSAGRLQLCSVLHWRWRF